ncbi:NAD-dependent deacylase [bacterium]|jgi:NAD-dependent deacetylase|nr:NAD-dependent deacylase [bacterium]
MKKIAIITGAGISQESGIETYRDKGGLWTKYDPSLYASIRGWTIIRDEMNEFYNERRKELGNVLPNKAHIGLVELEKYYNVSIITQNVDDLHQRAGSSNILHLHGELRKIRKDQDVFYKINADDSQWIDIEYNSLNLEEKPDYRPAVVFFGEDVPMISKAQKICNDADIIVVIGTSLQVYPAAGLIRNSLGKPTYIIDPDDVNIIGDVTHYKTTATKGVKKLLKELCKKVI